MATQAGLEQMEFAEPTQTVDDTKVAADPFQLPFCLRTTLDAALADLKWNDSSTLQSGGGQALAAFNLLTAIDQLKTLFFDGFNYVRDWVRTRSPRASGWPCYPAYGSESGQISVFTDADFPRTARPATDLRAIRLPSGGVAEVCGTSTTTTVSVANLNTPTPASPTNSGSSDTTPK